MKRGLDCKVLYVAAITCLLFRDCSCQKEKDPSLSIRNMAGHPFRAITVAVPNMEMARKFARELVKMRLAATVNIMSSAISVYEWDNEIRETPEIILLMYTHVDKYDEIEKFIRTHHVHAEPGIVALPIVGGSSTFFQWLEKAVRVNSSGFHTPTEHSSNH